MPSFCLKSRPPRGAFLATVAVLGFSAPALADTDIDFSLDWKFEGPAAPFLLAEEKGYFDAEGLDVSIDTGAGSVEPINRVASGVYDMGFGDINSVIKFNDQNPDTPIKSIYIVYNKPPFAIVGRRSLGISEPGDLEGKTLGAPAPDGAYAQWPIFVEANDIDADSVTIENVGFPVREPMLAAGDVDAITGFSFSSFINLKANNVPVDDIAVLLMADHGVDLYGNTIIVSPAFAEENPEAVKGFLRALNKAVKETIADPEAAVDYVLDANAILDKETELERLQMAINQNVVTDEVKENGLGAIDTDRMDSAIDQIGLTFTFASKPEPGDVFDPSFLPAEDERALD
ncbi:ABC transporter substrate-binding protein [Bauldia sp.]|uniref:ABC transporter substrate-binding protein n=1 Tax=Bauldia sp. TaxID=2575872 RepID=UPI003BADAD59